MVEVDAKGSDPSKKSLKLPLAQRRRARRLVVQALYQWQLSGTSPVEIKSQFIETNSGKIDWDYFSEVFLSVTEKIEPLEVKLTEFLDRELSALDPIERALLCLGSYELADRIDIPYRVVINECVELAKIFGATESHKYINGVLDNLALNLRPLESNSRV